MRQILEDFALSYFSYLRYSESQDIVVNQNIFGDSHTLFAPSLKYMYEQNQSGITDKNKYFVAEHKYLFMLRLFIPASSNKDMF